MEMLYTLFDDDDLVQVLSWRLRSSSFTNPFCQQCVSNSKLVQNFSFNSYITV